MKRPTYDEGVFVNCPFDSRYRPLFRAITFAVYDCGFMTRSALEHDNAREVRYDKILRIIRDCRYGIHDLSRVELDRTSRLPRFNMPFELGLFLGASGFGSKRDREKECLVLEREPYRYQTFCSDISGQDIHAHRGDPATAIRVVRNWLSMFTSKRGVVVPSGSIIARRYRIFESELPRWCKSQKLVRRELTFAEERDLVERWLSNNPWQT